MLSPTTVTVKVTVTPNYRNPKQVLAKEAKQLVEAVEQIEGMSLKSVQVAR